MNKNQIISGSSLIVILYDQIDDCLFMFLPLEFQTSSSFLAICENPLGPVFGGVYPLVSRFGT